MISIIVPIYNQELYINECIESILLQDYKDYEVILVNDGSTDGSKMICEGYVKENQNIYYYEQENCGVSVARNKGIDNAHGDWIMFVDPDDILDSEILTKLTVLVDSDVDIIACCCKVFINDERSIDYFYEESCEFKAFAEKKELIKQLFMTAYRQPQKAYTGIGVPWGKIYRKAFIDENGLVFKPTIRRMQDNVFNMYAFWKAKKVIYLNEGLYGYRLENISNYYKAKYKTFLFDNYMSIQKERGFFLKSNELCNDWEIMKLFYEDAISQIIDIFNSYLFNEMNRSNVNEKKKFYEIILNSENTYYKEAVQKMKYKDMIDKKHACLLILFKSKSYCLTSFVWHVRNVIKRYKNIM